MVSEPLEVRKFCQGGKNIQFSSLVIFLDIFPAKYVEKTTKDYKRDENLVIIKNWKHATYDTQIN